MVVSESRPLHWQPNEKGLNINGEWAERVQGEPKNQENKSKMPSSTRHHLHVFLPPYLARP